MLDYLNTCDPAELRRQLHPRGHPGFVWALPKEAVLRATEGVNTIYEILLECLKACGCPICEETAHEVAARWPSLVEHEDATPFDLLLLVAYAMGHEPEQKESDA
jgi:hypothetical protein